VEGFSLEPLEPLLVERFFEDGDILWRANENAAVMGILVSGKLLVVLGDGGSGGTPGDNKNKRQRNKSRCLQEILPGAVVGEFEFLARDVHPRTVIAGAESCCLMVLNQGQLNEIEAANPELMKALYRYVSTRALAQSKELSLFNAGVHATDDTGEGAAE